MPLTNYGEQQALNLLFGNTASGWPVAGGSMYLGLIKAKGMWTASATYAVGDLVIPNTYTGKVYRCSAITTGITSGTEPTWPTTPSGTVVDGGVTWQDVTDFMYNGTATTSPLTTYEVSSSGYARQALSNVTGASNWSTPGLSTQQSVGDSVSWGASVAFPTSNSTTVAWGYVCGFFIAKNSTIGDGVILAWNTLSNYVPMITAGMSLVLPSSGPGIKVTLT